MRNERMSPSTPPSSDGRGETGSAPESQEEKLPIGSNKPSSAASSNSNDEEKAELDADGSAIEKGEPQNSIEYPKGIEMFFIMLALVLSITVCSLDQVSSTAPSFTHTGVPPKHYASIR